MKRTNHHNTSAAFKIKPLCFALAPIAAFTLLSACGSQDLKPTSKAESASVFSSNYETGSHTHPATPAPSNLAIEGKDEIAEADDTTTGLTDADATLRKTDNSNQIDVAKSNANTDTSAKDTEMTVLILEDNMLEKLAATQSTLDAEPIHSEVKVSQAPSNDETYTDMVPPPNPRTLYYQFDQAELTTEQLLIVQQHADFLSVHPGYKVQVHGHTDKQGHAAYNERLAEKRAKAISAALQQRGVTAGQIEVFSWGSRDPEMSSARHADNRRVELIYLDDQVALSTQTGAEATKNLSSAQ